MKKYLLTLVLLLGATSLRAQFVGDLAVTRKVLSREGNTLHLVLDVQVSANAVTRSQSWTIIPELSTPDRQSMKLFPHILVNGRYQQHMMERRQVLNGRHLIERQPYVVINVDGKTAPQSVRYEMRIPYEAWMDNATLVLRQILTNPGRRSRVFTVDVNGAVDTNTVSGN